MLKLGNRVTVKSLPAGHPGKMHEGKKGGVVQIGTDGPVPQTDNTLVLVDDQYLNHPKQEGSCTMREWFKPEELELG
jgi:hypothetical protein